MLEDFLRTNARLYPSKTALSDATQSLSYSQLYEISARRAESIADSKERCIVMRSSQTADFLIDYFAVHMAGKVAVPLEKDAPEAVVQATKQLVNAASIPEDAADILFTTGTTGKSKGVIISHSAIIADAENLIDAQGFSHELTFVVGGPLNHIGSLSKVFPMIYLGGTTTICKGMKDMDAFLRAMEQAEGKTATFLVPASIKMLLTFAAQRLATLSPKIDFIETGATPMPQTDMEQLCKILPLTRLYNTYASTETGIITTHNYNSDYCVAGCLGRPMRHSSIEITDEGRIACSGRTLMSGYAGDVQATANILKDGKILTSDSGRIDSEGRLHIVGRADDVININGYKVAPTEVENAAMAFEDIADCICVPTPHPYLGTALKLIAVTKDGRTLDKRALAAFLKTKLEAYKVPMFYENASHIQRTYNGKPDRKFYKS